MRRREGAGGDVWPQRTHGCRSSRSRRGRMTLIAVPSVVVDLRIDPYAVQATKGESMGSVYTRRTVISSALPPLP